MSQLQIRLLGQFQVILDGAVASGFVSDKARALLAYLATEGGTPQRRETLANLLWSNMADTRARANFRRALSNLRKVIGDLHADPPFLQVTRHDIKIHPESNAWADVAVLSQVHGIGIPTSKTIPQFDAVLDLYKGKFLIGFNLPDSLPFDEWVLLKREGYARMMDVILQRVTDYYEGKGDHTAALPFAWRHVELEPWQERARRQLMRLLVHTGRRDEALQQYYDLEGELNAALNIKPGAKTRQLFETILAGKAIPLPERLLKPGLDEPLTLPAFLHETQVQASVPRETFFARQDELERLENALKAAITGRGCVIMVAGEAGSGKTMLVREFLQRAQSQYPELVSAAGYCNAFIGMGDPYLPFREILYQLSGDVEDRWKAGAYSRKMAVNLWHTVPITCQALLTYGPDLIDRLLPAQTLLAFTAPFAQTQPNWYRALVEHLSNKTQEAGSGIQQASLFSQLSEVLQKISGQVPLLLFLDDLQWADAGTIGMLFQFLKHIEHSRILLVGAYRSEEVRLSQGDERHPLTAVLHEFQRQFGDVFLNLDQSSGRDFIEGILNSLPNEILTGFGEQLYRLTGGNALFTVEVLRSMRESGILIRDGRGVWVAKSDLRLEKLPSRTEGVIAERVSRLPKTYSAS